MTQPTEKLRVLFAIGGMYSGGSERQLLTLLTLLDRDRYAPELYLISEGGELSDQIPDDVPVHIFSQRCPEPKNFIPGTGFRARIRDMARVLEERNIQLIYDRTFHMALISGEAARIRPTPRISTIVSDPPSVLKSFNEKFQWMKRRLLRRSYRTAEVVATVSEGVRQSASQYHRLPLEKFHVFPNMFDVEAILRKAASPLSEALQRTAGVQRIVATGRLTDAKAYDRLIEAMRILRDEQQRTNLELLIAGGGELEGALRQQIESSNLSEAVKLTGYLGNPLPLVKSADLFCLASRFEGSPNSLVEAMLCGIPCVATDCPHGPSEILEEGRWGALVPPEDSHALANALAGALDHLEPFRKRAVSAQQAVAKRFSLSAGLARFDELVQLAMTAKSDR
ncbi:MAG TPA: glycosyltransferase [Planctomycetaceae bacterium]|nr:glycosyltransferase [Planctomycetaceae bacterium]